MTVCLTLYSRYGGQTFTDRSTFRTFQITYLGGYLLAKFGDWLQGPYVYVLYDAYGYSKKDISTLFVAGFGSSMIFGTFVGSLADKKGRKKFVLLFCLMYMASC